MRGSSASPAASGCHPVVKQAWYGPVTIVTRDPPLAMPAAQSRRESVARPSGADSSSSSGVVHAGGVLVAEHPADTQAFVGHVRAGDTSSHPAAFGNSHEPVFDQAGVTLA